MSRAWTAAMFGCGSLAVAACLTSDDDGATAPPHAGAAAACDTQQNSTNGSPACMSCVQCAERGTCATVTAQCAPGGPCAAYLQCIAGCATQCDANHDGGIGMAEKACYAGCVGDEGKPGPATCGGKQPVGAKHWAQYLGCIDGTCSHNCGRVAEVCNSGVQLGEDGGTCAACLSVNCCDEYATCIADDSCRTCVLGEGGDKAACDASTRDEEALGCMASKCTSVCLTGSS